MHIPYHLDGAFGALGERLAEPAVGRRSEKLGPQRRIVIKTGLVCLDR